MALRAPLRELEPAAAVRAGPDEGQGRVLLEAVDRGGPGGLRAAVLHLAGARVGHGEGLLDALLLLQVLLDHLGDRVGARQDLVGAEADGAVGADAAELLVDLAQ